MRGTGLKIALSMGGLSLLAGCVAAPVVATRFVPAPCQIAGAKPAAGGAVVTAPNADGQCYAALPAAAPYDGYGWGATGWAGYPPGVAPAFGAFWDDGFNDPLFAGPFYGGGGYRRGWYGRGGGFRGGARGGGFRSGGFRSGGHGGPRGGGGHGGGGGRR